MNKNTGKFNVVTANKINAKGSVTSHDMTTENFTASGNVTITGDIFDTNSSENVYYSPTSGQTITDLISTTTGTATISTSTANSSCSVVRVRTGAYLISGRISLSSVSGSAWVFTVDYPFYDSANVYMCLGTATVKDDGTGAYQTQVSGPIPQTEGQIFVYRSAGSASSFVLCFSLLVTTYTL